MRRRLSGVLLALSMVGIIVGPLVAIFMTSRGAVATVLVMGLVMGPWAVLSVAWIKLADAVDHDERDAARDVGREQWALLASMVKDDRFTDDDVATMATAMGPVPGSFADHGPGRCHHLWVYPGCRGGCARFGRFD